MPRLNQDQRTIKNLSTKFPYILAWGRMLGSRDYYIANELIEAQQDNAPKDALYQREDSTWSRAENLAADALEMLEPYLPKEV